MFEICINLPGRPETIGSLSAGVYRIGKSPAAHIQIDRPEVSARHAVLTVTDEDVSIHDAGSRNGTFMEKRRIPAQAVAVEFGAVIKIGEATIVVREKGQKHAALPPSPPASEDSDTPAEEPSAAQAPSPAKHVSVESQRVPLLQLSGIPYEYRKVIQSFKIGVHDELLLRLNLKNLTISGADAEEVRRQARETIGNIIKERESEVPRSVKRELLEDELINEAVGLGPLEMLLRNSDITEIMVNGAANVYVEQKGTLYKTDLIFADDNQVLKVIERIVAPIGRRIDESQPLVDARLKDGSRVNAIIPPLAIDGPSLTIRKFSDRPMTVQNLIDYGSITQGMTDFIQSSVIIRKNILISGGTGSGKTTLLNVVSDFIPNSERIVTIEDAAELRLGQEHVVRLEARPPNIEGKGQIAIRDLVRNSLRMRPDRIVIGECRSGEALDMLQAMNTGHDGSLTTVHANSSRDALSRLETLVLMAGFDLPLRAIREQISSAISLIVHVSRMSDGTRKVMAVSEVTGMEGDVITTQDLFEFEVEGTDSQGRVVGRHRACGMVPTFAAAISTAGLPFDLSIFNDSER